MAGREIAIHLAEPCLLEATFGDRAEMGQFHRLRQKIFGAVLHGLHGEGDITVPVTMITTGLASRSCARHRTRSCREADVEQHDVGIARSLE